MRTKQLSGILKHLPTAPDWVLTLYREIDTLEFHQGLECFTAETELQFGTAHLTGVEAIKAFLIKVDGPLNIKHHVLDFWDSEDIKIVRGEAVMAKKTQPDQEITAPLMNVFYMSPTDPGKVARWLVVAGPMQPEKLVA